MDEEAELRNLPTIPYLIPFLFRMYIFVRLSFLKHWQEPIYSALSFVQPTVITLFYCLCFFLLSAAGFVFKLHVRYRYLELCVSPIYNFTDAISMTLDPLIMNN